MNTYTFKPQGVCSMEMQVDLDEQNIIREFRVTGGCHGNPPGIAALGKDMPAAGGIRRPQDNHRQTKGTPPPDQLARGLEQALSQR